MKIPFSPPDIGEEEIAQVVDTLRSGWITTGPKTKELERQVAQFCRTNRAVCLNSATAALELTLHQLGIGEGDEVITCAYTYTASASVACHVGAKLVLVDCQKDGYEMDYDALEVPSRRAPKPSSRWTSAGSSAITTASLKSCAANSRCLPHRTTLSSVRWDGWLWLPTQPMPLERAATEKCAAKLQILPVFPSMRSKTLPPQRGER